MHYPLRPLLLGGIVFSLTACDGLLGPAKRVDAIWVSATDFRLEVGESYDLIAHVSAINGPPADLPPMEWTSSDPAVLVVGDDGLVTARSEGRATVRVRLGRHADSARIVVGPHAAPAISWRSVHSGDDFTCALSAAGERYCWGENPFGGHGSGARQLHAAVLAPVPANDPLRYTWMSAGYAHACGLAADGAAYCWGNNSGRASYYELSPQRIAQPGRFREMDSGSGQSCALDSEGRRSCWGSNLFGEMGMPTPAGRQIEPRVADEPHRFRTIAMGIHHGCGITPGGETFCWGTNQSGQSGSGTAGAPTFPVRVSTSAPFASVAAGRNRTCALTDAGIAYCWGEGLYEVEGSVQFSASALPVRVPGDRRFVQLAVGGGHTCGRTEAGEVYCWGSSAFGEAGVAPERSGACWHPSLAGASACVIEPAAVAPGLRFVQISAGMSHTCGVTAAHEIRCWGRNQRGQLGIGRIVSHTPAPTPVAAPVR